MSTRGRGRGRTQLIYTLQVAGCLVASCPRFDYTPGSVDQGHHREDDDCACVAAYTSPCPLDINIMLDPPSVYLEVPSLIVAMALRSSSANSRGRKNRLSIHVESVSHRRGHI